MRRLRTFSIALIACLLISTFPVAADDVKEYLALGDSVAFGFDPLVRPAARSTPSNFVGYPEALAPMLGLSLTNASCPGEASGGFISLASALDNGCRRYREFFPLHVAYSTSQLDFAVEFVRNHPRTRLITIDLGANDLFLLQRACAGRVSCVQQNLPGLLATLRANLATIYARLEEAGFRRRLVALTYYALDYTDPTQLAIIGAINEVVADVTIEQRKGIVADGFDAFAAASAPSGNPCAAGLLIRLSSSPLRCDIHPSPLGRDVLAQTIREALGDSDGADQPSRALLRRLLAGPLAVQQPD